MISRAMEDYLKAIYKLGHEGTGGPVTTGALAEALAVAAPSATGMLKKLAELHLVAYHPRRGVTLTPAGEKVALEVVRHHRLLEAYLAEALGYGWDEVHDEADRLEHHVSDELEDRMDAALGYPTVDPHGDPIPSREGVVVAATCRPLTALAAGERGAVGRVSDADPGKLRYLAELGLRPGVAVTLLEELPFNGPLRVRVGPADEEHLLGRELAADVYVVESRE
ncbi:MAG TPA: metal-dependent transcriptional regulator [Thermomicrobiales bacterium]|nr:metal-dependent transcriptional regulator [Thermomicrobiales bacterium]